MQSNILNSQLPPSNRIKISLKMWSLTLLVGALTIYPSKLSPKIFLALGVHVLPVHPMSTPMSLRAAVMIWHFAWLTHGHTDTHTDRQLRTGYTIGSASWAKNSVTTVELECIWALEVRSILTVLVATRVTSVVKYCLNQVLRYTASERTEYIHRHSRQKSTLWSLRWQKIGTETTEQVFIVGEIQTKYCFCSLKEYCDSHSSDLLLLLLIHILGLALTCLLNIWENLNSDLHFIIIPLLQVYKQSSLT